MTEEDKNVIQHLEQEIIRANSRFDGLREALEESKHGSELRGWAIDRAIRIAEVNEQPVYLDVLKAWADELVDYANTFKKIEVQ